MPVLRFGKRFGPTYQHVALIRRDIHPASRWPRLIAVRYRDRAAHRLREEGRDPSDERTLRLAVARERKLWISEHLTDLELAKLGLRPGDPDYDERFAEVLPAIETRVEEGREKVVDAGGLFIIGTERHESRRIDNQLRGRSGRQGDPGSTRFYASLDDEVMRLFGGERLTAIMDRVGFTDETPIEAKMISRSIERAQSKVENHNYEIRKSVLEYDDAFQIAVAGSAWFPTAPANAFVGDGAMRWLPQLVLGGKTDRLVWSAAGGVKISRPERIADLDQGTMIKAGAGIGVLLGSERQVQIGPEASFSMTTAKVDRSAAYMGRWVAKNIVAAGLADRCEVQFAYAIGHPDPVSVHIDTFGTEKTSVAKITRAVNKVFSFQPADIVAQLNLLRPIYSKTTNYGHFGKNDKDLTWESITKADALKKAL